MITTQERIERLRRLDVKCKAEPMLAAPHIRYETDAMMAIITELEQRLAAAEDALLFYCHRPEYSIDEQGRRVTRFVPVESGDYMALRGLAATDLSKPFNAELRA